MDSGRIFRAMVMFLTLVGVLWAIRQVTSSRIDSSTRVAKGVALVSPISREHEVHSLPLVAIDNTCRSDEVVDLAMCTGLSTKGSGQSFYFELIEPATISIEVKPEYELFDPGFAVYDAHENCVTGREQNPGGMAEATTLKMLPVGRYRLVIGGYSGDCGPFTLTVAQARALVSDISTGRVLPGPNGTSINWRTFGEHEIEYFEIVRMVGGEQTVAARIRSRGGPARGEEYKYLDRELSPPDDYQLFAVGRDGRREELARLG